MIPFATIVFSGLLARVAMPPSATPLAVPSPASVPDEMTIRRGPETARRMRGPHATDDDVTISNSGSTNAAGYSIVVHPDRTADVIVGDRSETQTIGAAQARWLFAKVRAAMPFDAMASSRCMKSMSFGSSTTISFMGQRTPDLSCPGDATTRELMRTASVIAAQVRLPVWPRRPLFPR